jgi:DNA-binding NtrC family response regulator
VKNVLIVEDPGAIRSMLQLPFEAMGRFFAVEVGNGFEVLKNLPARRFNFIITDINSLKLISFVKSSSSHTMQAVVE